MTQQKRKITMERSYQAAIEDVWELWTTAEGVESWWGPEGFAVKVHQLDLRPGGEMRYAMSAVAPEQIAFMKSAGMPVTTEAKITYTEVSAPRRLAFTQLADFIPGVAPYDVAMLVELHASGSSVRMVLTLDAMHNEEWTRNMVMGWESELGRIGKALESRSSARR